MRGLGHRAAVRRLARTLGVTEGQATTLVIGLAVGLTSAIIGIPPTLQERTPLLGGVVGPAPAFGDDADAPRVAGDPAGSAATRPGVTGSMIAAPTPAPARPTTPRGGGGTAPEPAPSSELPELERYGATSLHHRSDWPTAGIAVDEAGVTWVAANGPEGRSAVIGLDGEGSELHRLPVAVDPAGRGLRGLAAGADGLLVVSDAPAELVAIDADGTTGSRRAIPDLPPCLTTVLADPCEPGAIDHAPAPTGVAVGRGNVAYVADSAQATIWRFAVGGQAQPWFQAEELISDSGARGLAVDGDGHLVISVTESVVAAGGGAVYLLEVDDGDPGALHLLTTTEPGSEPAGLAIGATGRVYLALSGADQVAVLEPDGTEDTRLPTAPGALRAPVAVTFHGQAILVTAAPPDADEGLVVRIVVGEPAVAMTS